MCLCLYETDDNDMIESNLPVKGTTSVQRRFYCPKARDKISNWLKAASKDRLRLEDCIKAKNIVIKALVKETQLCEYLKMVNLLILSKHAKKFLEEICLFLNHFHNLIIYHYYHVIIVLIISKSTKNYNVIKYHSQLLTCHQNTLFFIS